MIEAADDAGPRAAIAVADPRRRARPATASPAWRRGPAAERDRRRARDREGDRQLPPPNARRRRPRRTPGAARSSRCSAAAACASASCATCAPRRPPARPRRRALPDPRRQDRGRHPRGADDAPTSSTRFTEHLDRLRAAGQPTGPDAYAFPNLRGGRISASASARSSTRRPTLASDAARGAQGLPPLPNTTPHTLRRTYISIALLANGFDVKWVMSQVGHADSKMTLDVYAQLEQRVERSHGTSFDALLRRARSRSPRRRR